MLWHLLSQSKPKNTSELIGLLLSTRDIQDANAFLSPTSPLDLTLKQVGIDSKEMRRAVKRLQVAKEKKESIVIYGDYDCDGVCATTVLWETLYTLGYKVMPFIPHRERHGYGLSQRGVDEILGKEKPDIVISVDNGIVAHTQWQRLKDAGVFTILTDHHEPDDQKSPADIVIHTIKLCGTTVAWMLAREITKNSKIPASPAGRQNPCLAGRQAKSKIAEMLDLCAIATIADQVPLVAANRSFAKYGLERLNRTDRLGLLLLIESAGLVLGQIDVTGVNYGIAPRINAMGRLESALDALRALCTQKREKAVELISKLQDTNRIRQELTSDLLEKAFARSDEWKDEHIIIIEDSEFHEGVIGLIASKLTETFFKPAIALSVGPLATKGSARSLAGVHITHLLRQVQSELLEVGGHPMAAGLKIETSKIASFKKKLYALAKETIDLQALAPSIAVDCALSASLCTIETAQRLATLSPFGSGNPEPVFLIEDMIVKSVRLVGKEGKHLKLNIQYSITNDQQNIEAIGFGMGKRFPELSVGQSLSVIGKLSINSWNSHLSSQIQIKDFIILE